MSGGAVAPPLVFLGEDVSGLRHDIPQNRTRTPLGACMTLDIGLLDFDGSKNRKPKDER